MVKTKTNDGFHSASVKGARERERKKFGIFIQVKQGLPRSCYLDVMNHRVGLVFDLPVAWNTIPQRLVISNVTLELKKKKQ